jgi:hypothetical protein
LVVEAVEGLAGDGSLTRQIVLPSPLRRGPREGGNDGQEISHAGAGDPAEPAEEGAAGALGAAAATAITATPASAADGDPLILGQVNESFSATSIINPDVVGLGLVFNGGGFLSAVTDLGTCFSASTLGGPAIFADAGGSGVIASGYRVVGVRGESGNGIGVHGRSEIGTGIKAEAGPHVQSEGTAFEAVGPVKFSTSGLADIGPSTDRVTVNPGVPITSQSKVLAMLQGNSGNKAMVEHVELNAAAGTFQVVLTKASARPVQTAWFLMSWGDIFREKYEELEEHSQVLRQRSVLFIDGFFTVFQGT